MSERQDGGAPSAADELRNNAKALSSWMESLRDHQRELADPVFGRGYGIEQRVNDALEIGARLAASVIHIAETVAQTLDAPNTGADHD